MKGLEALCLDSISGRLRKQLRNSPARLRYSQYQACCLLQWHEKALAGVSVEIQKLEMEDSQVEFIVQ